MTPPTVGVALDTAVARLRAAGLTRPRLEAEILLAHLLEDDRAALWRTPEAPLARDVAQRFVELCRRRAGGEPVAYLTGVREFWSLPMAVDGRVLVPRPETEHLVETVLERLPGGRAPVVDVGTGSGCIALALAHERPDLHLIAIERAAGALEVAAANARRLRLQVAFLQADGLSALGAAPCLQAVVSNPPYLPAAAMADLPVDVREHEPRLALTPGPEGLELTRSLVRDAARLLLPGGLLALEIDAGSEAQVRALLAAEGWGGVEVRLDLAGLPRVVAAAWRG
jgi:release factor glutamine methyltransferase